MNEGQRRKLFKNYYKLLKEENYYDALKCNRAIYHEIFSNLEDSNGNKEILEAGLDQLEIEATGILKVLKLNLNPMEEL